MESEILDDENQVRGQIYLMKNNKTGKCYVGQTLTHRKNHNRYRPFGFMGRFQDHISEALCNTKKKQCWYLNNSIRQYGKEVFSVTLLETCSRDILDEKEQYYIKLYNSIYPNGYNLTYGGKTLEHIHSTEQKDPVQQSQNPSWRSQTRSDETKEKMSKRLKEVFGTQERKTAQMLLTQKQHAQQKYDRFKNINIDTSDLDKYIYIKKSKGIPYVILKVEGKQLTSFVGKYQTLEELKEKARAFLQSLSAETATFPN